jgi:hypothetical protein
VVLIYLGRGLKHISSVALGDCKKEPSETGLLLVRSSERQPSLPGRACFICDHNLSPAHSHVGGHVGFACMFAI